MGSTSVGALGISLGASSVLGREPPGGRGGARRRDPRGLAPADVGHATERLSRELPLATFLPAQLRLPGDASLAGAGLALAADITQAERGARPGQRRLLRDGATTRSGALLGGQPHRRRQGPGPRPASRGRQDHPGAATRRCSPRRHGNDLVRVWILPGGGHGALDASTRTGPRRLPPFFERWASYPDRDRVTRWFTPEPASGKVGISG